MFQPFWSQVTDPGDLIGNPLNKLPKHVATSRPDSLTWNNTQPIRGDLVGAVRELKKRPRRELQVHGSHGLIQTLLAAGLIDQFNILIYPVIVGEGKRLFDNRYPGSSLRLVSSEVTSKGVIFARYVPTGAPDLKHSFAVKDGKEVRV